MSKQSDQRYRKERGLNHKERAKDSTTENSVKDMPSREGFGDGNPLGAPDPNKNKNR